MSAIVQEEQKQAVTSNEALVLLVHQGRDLPFAVKEAVEDLGLENCVCRLEEAAGVIESLPRLAVAVLAIEQASELEGGAVKELIKQLRARSISTLVLSDEAGAGKGSNGMLYAGRAESGEMLKGRLATLLALQPGLEDMARELNHLDMMKQPLNSYFAQVDEEICSGCGLCIPACSYDARAMHDWRPLATVNAALCEGCGACAVVCPNKASRVRNFTARQVLAMVEELL